MALRYQFGLFMSNINQYFEKEECKGKATMNKAIQFNFTYHPNEGLSK